ncbi:Zinc finger, RING-type [Dillenia turbinata]|uniref:Zinc finger, RING-type n=1 Tax=Dillenia turbinata TaxID=194707 RepID=A0AAN8Z687_9MAGN
MEEQDWSSLHVPDSDDEDCRDESYRGMEGVIATVSGYHGLERFNLIKLISHTGASYVGAMNRSTTHLVCWKFEGQKYDLARKFETKVVNHKWVEDCVKQGKRIPEGPYMLNGEELGPLSLDVSLLLKKANLLAKKDGKKVLDEPSSPDFFKEKVTDLEFGGTGDIAWTKSSLLLESPLLEIGSRYAASSKSKEKTANKPLNQDRCSLRRNCSKEPSSSGYVGQEVKKHGESSFHFSECSTRQKRNTCDGIGRASEQSSCKSRRLVKRKATRDVWDFATWDLEDDYFPVRDCSTSNPMNQSDNYNRVQEENFNLLRETADDHGLYGGGVHRNDDDEFFEIEDFNQTFTIMDTDVQNDVQEQTSKERDSDLQNVCSEIVTDSPVEDTSSLATSSELSCVICWTEFSSTRGILPCGHRFCYSCIQNWADHMASMRRTSSCPLCKASFLSIMKVDDAASSDQKIYSQCIPCAQSTADIFILPDRNIPISGGQPAELICCKCHCREPEDLLIGCILCQTRLIHSYCLDPPLFPWTCAPCKDLRMLYRHLH